jgi:hypothetical protein
VQDNDPIAPGKKGWDVPMGILAMVFACFAVYSALFATGYWIYGQPVPAAILTAIGVIAIIVLIILWRKMQTE